MEKNTEYLIKLLKRFHNLVELTPVQLEQVLDYLFADGKLPHLLSEYTETLVYLREIIMEYKLKDILDLRLYYDMLAHNAGTAMTKIIEECSEVPIFTTINSPVNIPVNATKFNHARAGSVVDLTEQTVISQTGALTKKLLPKPALETKSITVLNSREIEFLKLACTEMTYKEIADKMFLSARTIDGYRDTLFEKLQVKSRVGLVLYAIKNRIVS